MRHKTLIRLLFIILTPVILLIGNSPLSAKGEIYAAGCIDNYPYEYINEAGSPAGFSVELINKIADETKLKCRIELLPYEEFLSIKNNPDVDIILGMIRGEHERDYNFFKTNVKIHFSIFSNSDSEISSINDLQNKRILIAGHNSISRQIMNELGKFLKSEYLLSDDEINAFTILKRNECDAVVMSGPSAKKIIENKNLIGVKEIPADLGFFDYGFGVRKDNTELRNILAEGYNKIFENGSYNSIYSKWFNEQSGNNFFSDNGIYFFTGISGLFIFIIFISINSYVLRKRIREKTEKLNLSMSELGKTQLQLKESEKRFRRIFNKSPSGLMILNSSGKILLFNEAIVDIFGVNNPDEISNLDVINSPVSTEWFKSKLKNYRDVNIELKFDFGLIRKTGYYSTSKSGIMILELIVIPIEINSGNPEPGYICQFSDNTRERKLIEEIRYNQMKLELIFESVKDGLWEWNLLTGKVRYNRKFFSFLGYKMEKYPDDISTLLGFIHEDDRDSVKNELHYNVMNGRTFNIEYRMLMSNGRIISVRSRGETIEWDDNLKPLRTIGIQTEITIRRDIYTRINLFKNDIEDDKDLNLTGCKGNLLEKRTILVVDDNYLIYLHISELLKKYNAKSIYAASGIEAIDIVRSRDDISLILLDHYMPGLDGTSVLREIRKFNQDIPVVVQTGQLNDTVHNQFFLDGFNGVLGKPVEENLLIETISSIIESVSL